MEVLIVEESENSEEKRSLEGLSETLEVSRYSDFSVRCKGLLCMSRKSSAQPFGGWWLILDDSLEAALTGEQK